MGKKVLVIGSGGREHALGDNIAKDDNVSEVLYAPGNGGTEEGKGRNVPIDGSKISNVAQIADLIEKEDIDLVVVGPEAPLVDGIADFFLTKGYYRVFGPTARAAQLEADKFYSFDVMNEANVPQADSIKCYTIDDAKSAIEKMATDRGVVIKARGLTGGKGVTVCDSKSQALSEIENHVAEFKSEEVLIAKRLFGQEVSVFGIVDGYSVKPIMVSLQDHKPLLELDLGPNTGGMGAYCPAPVAPKEAIDEIVERCMKPVLKRMRERGDEYRGFLYAGMIMTEDGLKVIEFNARFGDPECQPAMMMLQDSLYFPLSLTLDKKMHLANIKIKSGAACGVVMAANGYPKGYDKGQVIKGLAEAAQIRDLKVYHAGTKRREDGETVFAGGRVLCVTGYTSVDKEGPVAIKIAQERAYQGVQMIDRETRLANDCKQLFVYRRDIAEKAFR